MKHSSRMTGAFLILALVVSFAQQVQAQVAGASVLFLMIEPDSRSAGMGNAGVALADNAYATFWNPAGLAFQTGTEASITHSNWLPEFNAGLYYEYLVAKHKIPGAGTIGGHVTYLHLGEHEGRDEFNVSTGTFRSYDLSMGLSYGTKLSSRWSVGTGARFVYSNLAKSTDDLQTKPGVTAAFDLATLYRTAPFKLGKINTTFSAGANLSNMGPAISYTESGNADPIPTNLRFGYSFSFDFDQYNTLTLTNDFTKMLTRVTRDSLDQRVVDPFYKAIFTSWAPIEINRAAAAGGEQDLMKLGVFDQLLVGAGAEYWYNKLFAIRTGYFYENPYNGNRQFMTFGAGVRYNIVGVDFSYIYALGEQQATSETMRFSLLLDLGR